MDPISLATTAFTLISPFLTKAGEKISEKIGEDLWQIIKKPFVNEKDKNIISDLASSDNLDHLKAEIVKKLQNDPQYLSQVKIGVENAQKEMEKYTQQINNNSPIEKQVNIGNNSGSINF